MAVNGVFTCFSEAMSYWFHRNPLKATKPVTFEELKKSAKGGKINELITFVGLCLCSSTSI